MTDPTKRHRCLPGGTGEDRDIRELAAIFTAGYVRLLVARAIVKTSQNPLDVAGDNEAPLAKRVARRTKLA